MLKLHELEQKYCYYDVFVPIIEQYVELHPEVHVLLASANFSVVGHIETQYVVFIYNDAEQLVEQMYDVVFTINVWN